MKTGTECSKCFHTLIDKGDCDCFCHTLLTPPEDRFMKKADKDISYFSTSMIGNRCKHLEHAMVSGDGPHICQTCQIKAKDETIAECRNTILIYQDAIKQLQSRIEKLEKVILKYVLHDKDCTLQQNRGARPALDVSHCNCGLNEALSNEKEKE